jgi:hypothetical protein
MSDSDSSVERRPRTAWEEAEAEGMDMSLIECNLRRPVWERMVRHDRALAFALELREAVQRRESDGSA